MSLLVLLFVVPAFSVCASEESMKSAYEELEMDDDEDGAQEGMEYAFEVMIMNVHDSQPLSPGVFVVHTADLSLNFEGEIAPPALESLAEYGSNADFADYVEGLDGAIKVYTVDAPILPGMNASMPMDFQTSKMPLYLSGVMMDVGTNDGYALLDAVELVDEDGMELSSTTDAENYDAGTEENQLLGSGFEGGQPDPSRGEENIENGVPTEEMVMVHPELSETVMEVVVTVA
ncbi:MAG TPA: hypothetical protein HA349_08840 [Methanotrichaceae archaeon]|nr:hypothetical protein [Methanotrichaceae archaeon]